MQSQAGAVDTSLKAKTADKSIATEVMSSSAPVYPLVKCPRCDSEAPADKVQIQQAVIVLKRFCDTKHATIDGQERCGNICNVVTNPEFLKSQVPTQAQQNQLLLDLLGKIAGGLVPKLA